MRMRQVVCKAMICLAAAMILLGGCMDDNEFYTQVHTSRVSAYNDWSAQQRRQQGQTVQVGGSLMMADALKLALMNNNELLAAVENRQIAKGKVVESYSAVLPSVSAVGDYTRRDELTGFEVEGWRIDFGQLDNYSAALVVRQPIYRGGAISAAMRAARLYALYSDEQVRAAIQKTLYETALAYYDTLLAQQLYRVNEDAVLSAEAQLADVQAKRGQGMASEYDVLRAQVDVSNFRAEMIQQKNRISLSKTKLLKAMGAMEMGELVLSDELVYEKVSMPLADAVRMAYENRPDLYLGEYELRLQKEAVTVAKSEYWPQAYGTFSQGWARPDPHTSMLDEWGDIWTAGVTIEWPLFSGLGREGRVMQEQAKYRQKQYLLNDAQQLAFLEVQQALLNLQDADELVDSQKLNLQRAQEGSRLAEVGFREGVTTTVELTDARSALTQASGLYYESLYAHSLSRLILQRAMGVLGPRAGQKQTTDIVKPGSFADVPAVESTISDPNSTGRLNDEIK